MFYDISIHVSAFFLSLPPLTLYIPPPFSRSLSLDISLRLSLFLSHFIYSSVFLSFSLTLSLFSSLSLSPLSSNSLSLSLFFLVRPLACLPAFFFLCSVQSSAFTVREFISIQYDDVILEFPLFTMNKLQSLCNDVNSTQTKPYSLRKTKALNKKLRKLNLPLSVNINFKDSNKCAILDFTNSAHYTGALHLFKESYPIKEITDVDGVLVEVTAALESPRVRVHWYLTQDRCMFQRNSFILYQIRNSFPMGETSRHLLSGMTKNLQVLMSSVFEVNSLLNLHQCN